MFSSRRVRALMVEAVVLALLAGCTTAHAYAVAGGTGEANDPYKIGTVEQLTSIGSDPNLLSRHYVLVADIDLDPNLPGGRIFDRAVIAPMAPRQEGDTFNGVFNGNGHKIMHMTLGGETATYGGLFGEIGVDGQVLNLGVEWLSIGGNARYSLAGGLAGSNRGLAYRCHSSGAVSSTHQTAGFGGLVGRNWGGRIVLCCSDCAVTNTSWSSVIGGLVGDNSGGEIASCCAAGTVTGVLQAGGLVGANSFGHITCCYASASASGVGRVGGLVGGNYGYGTVRNCLSIGRVSGRTPASIVGGLAPTIRGTAEVAVDGVIAQSFWDTETSRVTTSAGGVGLTTAQMMDIRTYLAAGWDFVGERANGTADTWQMPKAKGYPFLAAMADAYQPRHLAGAGTAEDPHQIATPEDLGAIGHYDESACYRLIADLDLSGIRWTTSPIERFDGLFHGNGHVISNLTLDGGDNLGLFGVLGEHAKVKNLGVADANIAGSEGASDIGVLAGSNRGQIDGCYATGTIRGQAGSRFLGGLVGSNVRGRISNCYVQGSVLGGKPVGGLMGFNSGSVSHCYARNAVAAPEEKSGEKSAGGLASGNGEITSCYFLQAPGAGDLGSSLGSPLTDAQMKQQSSFTGWDFDTTWKISEGKDYPRLRWER